MSAPTSADFRRLMGRWPTGVAVVTAHEGEHDYGLTVNSFLSVSLRPPTVLVSLGLETDTLPVIARTRRFAVSLLAADQRPIAERFALTIPPGEKFEGLAVHRVQGGLPTFEGAVAAFECSLSADLPSVDHRLLIGEVVALREGADRPPLLFHRSRYGEAALPDADPGRPA